MNSEGSRTWPPGRPVDAADALRCDCAACGIPWLVDPVMAGFKLRCECGQWVPVPARAREDTARLPAVSEPDEHAPSTLPAVVDEIGWIADAPQLEGPDAARVALNAPLGADTLRHSSLANRTRWTNRTILEFALLMAALLSPQIALHAFASGEQFEEFAPLASLAAAVLALPVVAWAGPFGLMGLRWSQGRYYAEALLAAPLWVLAAEAYRHALESALPVQAESDLDAFIRRLGIPAALFVISLTPAVLEELIFRGVLQGRLLALMGRWTGLLTTAALFAVCHLNPLGMAILFGVGLHLGLLRERSQSLLPGMLMHALYNGTLVVLSVP